MASNLSSKLGRYFEEHWDDTRFYPEVFYPKEFVTCFPWGECSESDDFEDSEDSEFDDCDIPEFENSYDFDTDETVQISEISHITHKRNVVEMDTGTHYCFRPKKKYGKCSYEVTDGSTFGESYRCDLTSIRIPTPQSRYTHVTGKQHVLPDGYYTWWGNSTADSSIYGSEKLTTSFKSALGTYKYGQTRDLDADVFLRIGGTLRYKKEICYVIIVHTKAEATDEIKRLPPLRDSDHFTLNGFLHEDGRVNWKTWAVPEFIPRSYIDGCFDHFAFAFYFNDCNSSLYLDKKKVDISKVRHNKCLHKFKVKQEFRPFPTKFWYCPEDKRLPLGFRQEDLADRY